MTICTGKSCIWRGIIRHILTYQALRIASATVSADESALTAMMAKDRIVLA